MEGHFVNISITKRVSLENSTDLGRGAAPELKSVEFLSETLLVVEQIDIHTNFTARQMLYLYRSITLPTALRHRCRGLPTEGDLRGESRHRHVSVQLCFCLVPFDGAKSRAART